MSQTKTGKPCGHETRNPHCRSCELAETDRRYQQKWGLQETAPPERPRRAFPISRSQRASFQPTGDRPFPDMRARPCRHELPIVRACRSGSPARRELRHIRACELHGECVRDCRAGTGGANGIVCCHCDCDDYDDGIPEKLFNLDEDDPLAGTPLCESPKSVTEQSRHRLALDRLINGKWQYPGPDQGDGVLFVGGGKYWPGIVVAITMLRRTGCQLPVEVWHRGAVEPLDPQQVAHLGDVRIIDACAQPQARPWRILGGWEMKAFAMQYSAFRRVFFIDADAYPVADVTPHFASLDRAPMAYWAEFDKEGNIDWHGVGMTRNPSLKPIQGGQIFFDRKACWHQLTLAHWMNQHSDFYYQYGYGDQDIWRMIWSETGAGFQCLGPAEWRHIAYVCSLEGRPLIVHRCHAKMLPGGGRRRNFMLPFEREAWTIFESMHPWVDPRMRPAG